MYIFENSCDNTFCSNTFEWCNIGIKPIKNYLQNISYITDAPNYSAHFDENNIFFCTNLHELSPNIEKLTASQKISSFLQCAIKDRGEFRGFVGFDICENADINLFTKEKIDIVSTFAKILAVFLVQERFKKQSRNNFENLSLLINNQDSWIYIINKETFEIEFFNNSVKQSCPDIALGDKCYKAIVGISSPCPDCPLKNSSNQLSEQSSQSGSFKITKRFPKENHGNRLMEISIKEINWNSHKSYMAVCEEKPLA